MVLQMEEQKDLWGIMSDWRLSYFTMMPAYQSMVLKSFAKLIAQGHVFRGDRPVFWSIDNQRVMGEDEMELKTEVLDCVIAKLPIKTFGKKC